MGVLGGYSVRDVRRAMQHGHPQMSVADLLGNPLPADLVSAQRIEDIRISWRQWLGMRVKIIDEYNRIPTRTQSALLTVMGDNYAEILDHVYECPDSAWYLTANDEQGGGTYQVPERRERWLAELFPHTRRLVVTGERVRGWFGEAPVAMPTNEAGGAAHRRFVARLCLDVLGTTVDAVFTSEEYGPGFAAELTTCFRERDPEARVVEHVPVDPARAAAPVSTTRIRADVHGHRGWLSPVVYADFVRRVCLLGGESSGKSTLAAALAGEFGTEWVPEYGRTRWEERGGALGPGDMVAIARRQIALEEGAARRAWRWLFCDTSPLTTLLYSHALFGGAGPELEALAARGYDVVVLCAADFPFVQDGTRRDGAFRRSQHDWYVAELARRGVPWVLAGGSVRERVGAVADALAGGVPA